MTSASAEAEPGGHGAGQHRAQRERAHLQPHGGREHLAVERRRHVLLAGPELGRQRRPVGQRRERHEGEEHRERVGERPQQDEQAEGRVAGEHDPLGREAALDPHQASAPSVDPTANAAHM